MDTATLNEDWLRALQWDLPSTLDGLIWALGAANFDHAGQVAALQHFTELPAWMACPPDLAKQVRLIIGQPQSTVNVSDARSWRYSDDQPRDDHGRFASGDSDKGNVGGGLPHFTGSVFEAVHVAADGKAEYIASHPELGSPGHTDIDYSKIMADPASGKTIAGLYASAPSYDPAAQAAYDQMIKETAQQHDYMTNVLGITHEVSSTDPYKNVQEMVADVRDNHHLYSLSTATTGGKAILPTGQPILTNEQNDQFRAVHDFFGHASTGRAFDRNGEMAAWISHMQMYSPLAGQAVSTETHARNSVLIYGEPWQKSGPAFAEQKVFLLPKDYSDTEKYVSTNGDTANRSTNGDTLTVQEQADADNLYEQTHSHHTSQGRYLPDSVADTPSAIRNASDIRSRVFPHAFERQDRRITWRYSDDQPRDPDGRFAGGDQLEPLKGGGGVGKSGKPLMSIENSASLSTLPAAETKNGTLAERSLATLDKYVGQSVQQLSDHTVELFNRAIEDDKNGVPWDSRGGNTHGDDTRTAIAAGTAWYQEAHDFAAGNSPDEKYNADFAKAGFTEDQGAAITAALSPQQNWESNMEGMKALTAAFANPDRQLTQAEADKLNTQYHSGSLGSFQTQDGQPWNKQTMGDPMKASGTGPRTQQEIAVWVPVKNADGTPFQFAAGMSMGDLMAGKLDPPDAPSGAAGAVALVGLNQTVSAGGSGYGNIEKAIQLGNGKDIDSVLAGAKVRSFFNCINAPDIGADPVIDSHMIEGMTMGFPPSKESTDQAASLRDHMTPIMGSPSVAGTSIGCYPALADAVRDATEKINSSIPGSGPGAELANGYSPAQVQAVVWLQQIHEHPNGVRS